MKKNFKLWLKAALVRACKTMAQTAIATIGTEAMFFSVNWLSVVSCVLMSAVLSLLMSVQGLPEVENSKIN